MALICPAEGEDVLLARILNVSPDDKIILFSNDLTPSDTTVFGDLSQPTGGGYAVITLSGSWSISAGTGNYSHPTTVTVNFVNDGVTSPAAWNVYGYAVINDAGNKILWAERFSGAPFSVPSTGGTISIAVKITLE